AFLGPTTQLSNEKGIRSAAEDFCRVSEWVPFESDIVYRRHEVTKYTEGAVGNESGVSDTRFTPYTRSEAVLSQVELTELALGLELLGLPFFWVIRKSIIESIHFPNGLLESVKGRGMVYIGWVPQVRMLSHSCNGGFLTHCGWNSTIKGLTFGRVLIFFPVMNDQ
nr:UDP-glycosyltransferase 91C1 [Tanacetum cinerariifolium]